MAEPSHGDAPPASDAAPAPNPRLATLAFAAGAGALLVLTAFVLIVERPAELERDVFERLTSDPGTVRDAWRTLTWLGSIAVLAPVSAAIAVWRIVHRDRRSAWVAPAALASAYVLTHVMKALVDRPRPPSAARLGLDSPAFPSGHAAQAAAVGCVLALMAAAWLPRRTANVLTVGAVISVILVGVSRVVVGAHWPLDVLGGWALGTASASAAVLLIGTERTRTAHAPHRAVACCYRDGPQGVELLLVRTRAGAWTLPGGKVDPGEEAMQAAAREAHEEAGVEGSVEKEPFIWVRVRKRPSDLLRGKNTHTPVFLLEVQKLGEPEADYRHPTWWPIGKAEQALRDGRPAWSGGWLVSAVRAARSAIERSREGSINRP